MTAEQDGLDLATIMAAHRIGYAHCGRGGSASDGHCTTYRLAALALDLQGKVARVEAERNEALRKKCGGYLGGGVDCIADAEHEGPCWDQPINRAAFADQPEHEQQP